MKRRPIGNLIVKSGIDSARMPGAASALRSFGSEAELLNCSIVTRPTVKLNALDMSFPNYRIAYVIDGSGEYCGSDGIWHRLEPGDMLQRFPRRAHSLKRTNDGRWREFCIVLPLSLYKALAGLGILDSSRAILRPGISAALIARIAEFQTDFAAVIDRDPGEALNMALQMLQELYRLDRIRRTQDPDSAALDQACERLRGRSGSRLRLDAIARECGMGYEKFRKLFAQRLKLSPKQYQLKHRIDQARRLLIERRMSVKEIAYELGYTEVANFAHHFKQSTGQTPSAYRRGE